MQENHQSKFITPETPSENIINEGNKSVKIYDEKGRAIVLKKPNVLDQFRIVEIVGPETAKNEVYMNMIMPVLFVQSIDEIPAMIGKKSELEALISRLGEDGITRVFTAVKENFSAEVGGKEEIKKS